MVVVELRRAAGLETVKQKQLALQGSESIVSELQKIVDDQRLSGESLASLQSEIDVLNSLRRNPLFDIHRFELTLAKAAELVSELDDITSETHLFLELVQQLGKPEPHDDGNQIGSIVEEAATPPVEIDTPISTTEPEEKSSFGKGIERGKERLGEDLIAKHLPRTATLAIGGIATMFGAKYGGAAGLVRAVVETLLAFLA